MGYNLGLLYQATDSTRVGVAYRSAIDHKLKGDIKFYGGPGVGYPNQNVSAKLKTPELLTLGIHHDINDKWSVMAEAQKTYWSNFQELKIVGDNGFTSTTHEGWKDSWFYSIGASYQVNDQWKIRGGLAFDQTPMNDSTRTPRIPDSDRYWISGGVEYKHTEKLTLNAGYTYIRGEPEQINLPVEASTGKPGLSANAQADIHLIGFSLNYAF